MRKSKIDSPKLTVLRVISAKEGDEPWDHIHDEPVPDALVQLARELQRKIESMAATKCRKVEQKSKGDSGRKE